MNKAVLYDVGWQQLRVSCLKRHHRAGGFATLEGTQDNISRLDDYVFELGARSSQPWLPYTEVHVRVWRALNLCNAVRMGYAGQQLVGSPQDNKVENFRNMLQEHYDGAVVKDANERWDWDLIEGDLEQLHTYRRYWFDAIQRDLCRRADKAFKKSGGLEHRTELERFLYMMGEVA